MIVPASSLVAPRLKRPLLITFSLASHVVSLTASSHLVQRHRRPFEHCHTPTGTATSSSYCHALNSAYRRLPPSRVWPQLFDHCSALLLAVKSPQVTATCDSIKELGLILDHLFPLLKTSASYTTRIAPSVWRPAWNLDPYQVAFVVRPTYGSDHAAAQLTAIWAWHTMFISTASESMAARLARPTWPTMMT